MWEEEEKTNKFPFSRGQGERGTSLATSHGNERQKEKNM